MFDSIDYESRTFASESIPDSNIFFESPSILVIDSQSESCCKYFSTYMNKTKQMLRWRFSRHGGDF